MKTILNTAKQNLDAILKLDYRIKLVELEAQGGLACGMDELVFHAANLDQLGLVLTEYKAGRIKMPTTFRGHADLFEQNIGVYDARIIAYFEVRRHVFTAELIEEGAAQAIHKIIDKLI